ncbi:hypothetical protein SAMN05421510_106712 [Nitrosomonas ureae]|uniref:Uncharacterized protein n=1 Tax=Nitrosomonas ureae TaxID=44577 RepID=A0A1H9GKZ4_9PROT|nr:hypothetical protein SAMN05421510_106712 [Nitrosomonas ureae]
MLSISLTSILLNHYLTNSFKKLSFDLILFGLNVVKNAPQATAIFQQFIHNKLYQIQIEEYIKMQFKQIRNATIKLTKQSRKN